MEFSIGITAASASPATTARTAAVKVGVGIGSTGCRQMSAMAVSAYAPRSPWNATRVKCRAALVWALPFDFGVPMRTGLDVNMNPCRRGERDRRNRGHKKSPRVAGAQVRDSQRSAARDPAPTTEISVEEVVVGAK